MDLLGGYGSGSDVESDDEVAKTSPVRAQLPPVTIAPGETQAATKGFFSKLPPPSTSLRVRNIHSSLYDIPFSYIQLRTGQQYEKEIELSVKFVGYNTCRRVT